MQALVVSQQMGDLLMAYFVSNSVVLLVRKLRD